MRFLHITKKDQFGSHKEQSEYFANACTATGVEYVRITEGESDPLLIERLTEEDIVYRSAASAWGKRVEKLLLHSDARHIYFNRNTVFTGKGGSYDLFVRDNIPVIPSISFFPNKKRDTARYIDTVGGLPLVVKVMGGMEGVGVIRVDSVEALNSLGDYIKKDPFAEYRIMKYVPHKYYGRLVVVDEKVVASMRDTAPLGDFRTNARGPRDEKGHPFTFSPEIEEIAVRAAQSVGVRFAGVDVLLGDDGNVYVAEANSPFNFAETQRITGIDVAGSLLRALIERVA